jgi:hypothetical protein
MFASNLQERDYIYFIEVTRLIKFRTPAAVHSGKEMKLTHMFSGLNVEFFNIKSSDTLVFSYHCSLKVSDCIPAVGA